MEKTDPNLLSLCIPTFNRAPTLEKVLPELIRIVRDYDFEIIVVDNNSEDETGQVVAELQKDYKRLVYYRQPENIGERNFESALQLSSGEYAWLLGDSNLICAGELSKLIDILNTKEHSAVFVNSAGRVKNIKSQIFTNPSDLLENVGWHISLICSILFSRNLIKEANFKRYYDTNFIQTGIVFEYLCGRPATTYWFERNAVEGIRKRSGWIDQVLFIFAKRWFSFILCLPPSIPLEVKFKAIKDHGVKSGLFSLASLTRFRMEGHLTRRDFNTHKKYLRYTTSAFIYWAFSLIMLIPVNLLINEKWLIRKLQQGNQKKIQ